MAWDVKDGQAEGDGGEDVFAAGKVEEESGAAVGRGSSKAG